MADIKKIEIDGTSYDIVGKGMPPGGASGKVLKKISDNDYDTEWADESLDENPLPSGGTAGQVLKKASSSDYDLAWGDEESDKVVVIATMSNLDITADHTYDELVAAVAAGKQIVLQLTDNTIEYVCTTYNVLQNKISFILKPQWTDIRTNGVTQLVSYRVDVDANGWEFWVSEQRLTPSAIGVYGIPSGGTAGQVLKKINSTNYAVEWTTEVGKVPSGGTVGQVLQKASNNNYDLVWGNVQGGGGDSVVMRGLGADSAVVVNTTHANTASGDGAFAAGDNTTASGAGAITVGGLTVASGICSFAGGAKSASVDYSTTASGNYSFAYGLSAKAEGASSVAIGQRPTASALGSAAIGNNVLATGRASMVVGQFNVADDNAEDSSHGTGARKHLFIVGNGTADDARSNAMTVDWDGNVVAAGKMTVGTAPTADMDVATKKYVDDNAGGGSSVSPYTSTPAALGTASAGSSDAYARGDHVHPMPSASDVGAYALPSGGIPATDLASAVQTSLGKADTALQSAPVTSVNGNTGAVVLSIPSTAADVGAIAAPSSPATGAFLCFNGSAWVAASLPTYNGGVS